MKLHYFLILCLISVPPLVSSQSFSSQPLASRLNSLKKEAGIVSISTLTKTHGGKDIIVAELGSGDRDNKPGIAVIGGIDGRYLYSTEVVVQMMERIVSQKPEVLDEVSFYFLPDMTPDASAQYNASLRYERQENARPYDDDRDGKTDEDGYDDMNNDGMITWMRILDPVKGEWMIHPDNPAVMVKADPSKNEKGEYMVIREGFDNDGDKKINEDLPGGIIFNRNFTFNYPYFGYGAGENAISEEETRALAKYLFDKWNIYAILIIGPENNLSSYSDLKAEMKDKKIPSSVHKKDKEYFEATVGLYKQSVRLADSAAVKPSGGDLLSWAYFHYTRFAFSTPGWNFPPNNNNMGSAEYDYLKWASQQGLKDQVVEWQSIDHPDFPGKKVEVGGIKPFSLYNPPATLIDTITIQHLDFLLKLASMHPALTFNDIKVTSKGQGLYMIEAEITNTGRMPTMSAMASQSKWVKLLRIDLTPSDKQEIIGGKRTFLFNRMEAGETVKVSWLVTGKGTMKIKAGSPQTGFIDRNIELN